MENRLVANQEIVMSQSQFNTLLDQVKNQMVFSIKEWIIPYVDKLANNQSQGQSKVNEDLTIFRLLRNRRNDSVQNGLEPLRIREN